MTQKHRAAIDAMNAAADGKTVEALIEKYAHGAYIGQISKPPIDIYRQHFAEFVEKLRPLLAPAIPEDVIASLLAMGRVEWGTSLYQADEKHVEDMRDTLRITREYFDIEADNTAIHGVYLAGTNTVLAHTGNSPNSPQHARILVGAWNQLVDLAEAARSNSTGGSEDE